MFLNCKRIATFAVFGLLACGAARAQEGVEPQARGPVHEAYANPVEGAPSAGPVVEQEPPAVIEEVPPDQKPEGDHVTWIPGYWAWDDARNDFLWVSGFWRVPPPGRTWVPGNWRRAGNGYQWVAGYWAEPEQPETQYLPPPPAPLEAGPNVPAPGPDYVYVPGSWVYTTNRYLWRPGIWTVFRPGWVWIPAHYRWTPVGYVFIEGYWDYTLRDRGILFSPVYIDRRFCYRPRWYYSPSFVVYDETLFGAMFVRPGYNHYYFGDYFDARYVRLGYRSWFSVSFSRGYTYDPLFSYYSVHYRRDPYWAPAIREVYVARYAGDMPRPPVTVGVSVNFNFNSFAGNPAMARKYTNITKTTNIVNVTNVTNNVVNIKNITNNTTVNNTNVNNQITKFKLQPVTAAQKSQFVASSKQIQAVGKQRMELETKLHAQGGAVGKNDAPKSVKMNLPKAKIATTGAAGTGTTGTGTAGSGAIHHSPPPPVIHHGSGTTGSAGSSGTLPKLGTGTGGGTLPKLGTGGGNLPKFGTGTGSSGTGTTGSGSSGTIGGFPHSGPGAGSGKPLLNNPKPPPPKGGSDKDKDKDKK